MEKKGLRKLQLTRETLRNLSTDELSRVVGGTQDTDGCPFTVLPCNMDPLPTAVGCGFPSDGNNDCLTMNPCNVYSGMCGSAATCSPTMCGP
jgi:hypothetical protein